MRITFFKKRIYNFVYIRLLLQVTGCFGGRSKRTECANTYKCVNLIKQVEYMTAELKIA